MPDRVFVPLVHAASKLGLPLAWLRKEAAAGRIPALLAGKQWMCNLDSVQESLLKRACRLPAPTPMVSLDPTEREEAKRRRREFVREWFRGGCDDDRGLQLECAKAMKAAGLYAASTYNVDAANGIRGMLRDMGLLRPLEGVA